MAQPLLYHAFATEYGRYMKMNATINEARLAGIAKSTETESSEGIRHAQNSFLSELPGLMFGVITLGYIVSSLLALA